MIHEEFIPEEFTRKVATKMRDYANLPQTLRAFAAAVYIIQYFISREQAKKAWDILGRPTVDEPAIWMCILIARCVFSCADKPYFEELRRRLGRVDINSAFQEAEIVHYFELSGWKIDLEPESGKKGHDFDMLASFGETKISVEVTLLNSIIKSRNHLIRKINKKRSQLPSDSPGVIFLCFQRSLIDNSSSDEIFDADFLHKVSTDFFKSSQRVIALFYAFQVHIDGSPFGIIDTPIKKRRLIVYMHENPNPRFKVDLSPLGQGGVLQPPRSHFDDWFEHLLKLAAQS